MTHIPTPPPLVAVLGRKRAGKDTFAAQLVAHHGFERVAFADALRGVAYNLDPAINVQPDEYGLLPRGWGPYPSTEPHVDRRLAELVDTMGWEDAKALREVRRTLQRLGVAVRGVYEDFWVDAVRERLEQRTAPVVVTDCRFPNELSALLRLGATTVRVLRTDAPPAPDEHVSEYALDAYSPHHNVYAATGQVERITRAADTIVEHLF